MGVQAKSFLSVKLSFEKSRFLFSARNVKWAGGKIWILVKRDLIDFLLYVRDMFQFLVPPGILDIPVAGHISVTCEKALTRTSCSAAFRYLYMRAIWNNRLSILCACCCKRNIHGSRVLELFLPRAIKSYNMHVDVFLMMVGNQIVWHYFTFLGFVIAG